MEFKRIGSLTISTSEEESEKLRELYNYGIENGAQVEIIGQERLREIEPFITDKAIEALWAPTAGIINPFELVIALMENAMDSIKTTSGLSGLSSFIPRRETQIHIVRIRGR